MAHRSRTNDRMGTRPLRRTTHLRRHALSGREQTMSQPPSDGIHHNIPDSDYHADRITLSSSGARLLPPPSCPAKFRQYMNTPPRPRPEFDFGHLVHTGVLGTCSEIVVIN